MPPVLISPPGVRGAVEGGHAADVPACLGSGLCLLWLALGVAVLLKSFDPLL